MISTHAHSSISGDPVVRARGLTKRFGQFTAVDQIDFEIRPGEIVGFLGPNGAGKTTTIRMMLNVLKPNSGELTIFGETFDRHRKSILSRMNASSGTLTLPGKLTVLENLKVFADLYGIPRADARIDELLEKFDLTDLQRRNLYSLSTGQQVRVSLARAFINHPKLLLLDEPTASLDPDVADRVRTNLLQTVESEKTTVFLTSHNMMEVEKVCTRVLFLNAGKIQAEGSPRELARRVKQWTLSIKTKEALKNVPSGHRVSRIDLHQRELIVEIDRHHVGAFITELIREGAEIEALTIHEPTLEDFFVFSARSPHEKN